MVHALLRERKGLNYLISSLSTIFYPEASRNNSAEVTDPGLKLDVLFSNNQGESNGLTTELIQLCMGGDGALERN